MPTPTRGVWQLGGCEAGGWFGSIASPEGCKGKRGRSREGPPAQTDEAEACDKRSRPQVVTSAWVRHGGVNLQQEVVPHLTERPPRDSPNKGTPDLNPGVKLNIQPDRA